MTYVQPNSKTIQSIFDSIPERYDLLNTIFSLSLDRNWRREAAKSIIEGNEKSVLDIGVGTGKSIIEFLKAKSFELSVGCDFSKGMLQVARTNLSPSPYPSPPKGGRGEKVLFPPPFPPEADPPRFLAEGRGQGEGVNGTKLACADLHSLPFADESFDIVTSSFVLRSVQNMTSFLSEVRRMLTKNGKFVFLDLTRPTNFFVWNFMYKPYLNIYIPLIGKTVSRHEKAYQFLSQSIQHFVDPVMLKENLEQVGFKSVSFKPLTFGISTLFMGRKA